MSELNVTTLTNQDVQLCKAWVNFNGTGVVAIRDSFNVSSITDNSAGNYTVNYATAMADANYSVQVSADRSGSALSVPSGFWSNTTTAVSVVFTNNSSIAVDMLTASISIQGN